MQVQYPCCDSTGEYVVFEKGYKQQGLRMDFKLLPQIHHNKMAMLNENFPLSSTRYVQC